MMILRLPAPRRAFLVHSLRLQFLVRAARQGWLPLHRIIEEVSVHDFSRSWQESMRVEGELDLEFRSALWEGIHL
jgi:hypothetical protein